MQAIHSHPGTISTAPAGSTLTSRGRNEEGFVGRSFLKLVENTLVRRDDKFLVRKLGGCLDDLCRLANMICDLEY